MTTATWSDRKIDSFIAAILQTGVLASGLLVLIGGIFYVLHAGQAPVNYRVFDSHRAALHRLHPVIAGVMHLNGAAIIQLGILLLIATPVVRVAFSVVAFWVQRDRIYVGITLVVLAILFYSLFAVAR